MKKLFLGIVISVLLCVLLSACGSENSDQLETCQPDEVENTSEIKATEDVSPCPTESTTSEKKIIEDIQTQLPEDVSETSGVIDDVTGYGLLTSYDVKSRELTYTPYDVLEEDDAKKIRELRKQGMEPDFPNGFFIYKVEEISLSLPVSESVEVSLLDDEYILQRSSMDEVSERLEGHPEFLLCQLHMIDGVIVGIEERFVP